MSSVSASDMARGNSFTLTGPSICTMNTKTLPAPSDMPKTVDRVGGKRQDEGCMEATNPAYHANLANHDCYRFWVSETKYSPLFLLWNCQKDQEIQILTQFSH